MKSRRDTWKPGQVRYCPGTRATFEVSRANQGSGWWCIQLDHPHTGGWFIMQDWWPTDLVGDGHGR